MNNEKMAERLVRMAESLMSASTFKCPTCGTKVLENTGYCLKCKKKVKKAGEIPAILTVSGGVPGTDGFGIEELRDGGYRLNYGESMGSSTYKDWDKMKAAAEKWLTKNIKKVNKKETGYKRALKALSLFRVTTASGRTASRGIRDRLDAAEKMAKTGGRGLELARRELDQAERAIKALKEDIWQIMNEMGRGSDAAGVEAEEAVQEAIRKAL